MSIEEESLLVRCQLGHRPVTKFHQYDCGSDPPNACSAGLSATVELVILGEQQGVWQGGATACVGSDRAGASLLSVGRVVRPPVSVKEMAAEEPKHIANFGSISNSQVSRLNFSVTTCQWLNWIVTLHLQQLGHQNADSSYLVRYKNPDIQSESGHLPIWNWTEVGNVLRCGELLSEVTPQIEVNSLFLTTTLVVVVVVVLVVLTTS